MRRMLMIVASVGVTALAPAVAMGESATQAGYNPTPIPLPPGLVVKAASVDTATTHGQPPQEVKSGTLPFTGLDVGLMALLAVGLVGLGFGIRRATRSQDS